MNLERIVTEGDWPEEIVDAWDDYCMDEESEEWGVLCSQDFRWQESWGYNPRDVKLSEIMASFYTLQHLLYLLPVTQNVEERIRKAGEFLAIANEDIESRLAIEIANPLRLQVEKAMDSLVESCIEEVYRYTDMAIGGELRHMIEFADGMAANRSCSWVLWKCIREDHGSSILPDTARAFIDNGYGDVGGKRWAQATHLLSMYEQGTLGPDEASNKRLFLDRIFTLQHNTGSFLNKVQWGYNPDRNAPMSTVLNWHSSNPPNYADLAYYSSSEVRDLYDEVLSNEKKETT